MSEPLITPEQVKAARKLLGWTRVRLAARANTGERAIRRYEDGLGIAATLYLAAVRAALESAGVIFVEENGEGPSVRLRKAKQE
jgi:ribosome-binding protein aMBF1 (putative translation factor)